jgi:hypothetical protein
MIFKEKKEDVTSFPTPYYKSKLVKAFGLQSCLTLEIRSSNLHGPILAMLVAYERSCYALFLILINIIFILKYMARKIRQSHLPPKKRSKNDEN